MTATDSSAETAAATDGSGERAAMVTTKEKNDKAKNGGTAESTNKGYVYTIYFQTIYN